MVITRKTRNMRSLFSLKDKNDYKSYVIYKRVCSCVSRYIGEAKRNTEVRWNEHNNPTKIQNHQYTFGATLATVFRGLSFQMLRKMPSPGRT